MKFKAVELFCGAGMARLGMQDDFDIVYANDFDIAKAGYYRMHFGDYPDTRDLVEVAAEPEPPVRNPDLVWASFACQDFSVGGKRKGFDGSKSSGYKAMIDLLRNGMRPQVLILENVPNILTIHKGEAFRRIKNDLTDLGMKSQARLIDAKYFLPQSRRRMILIAAPKDHVNVDRIVKAVVDIRYPDTVPTLESILEPDAIWLKSVKRFEEQVHGNVWAARHTGYSHYFENHPVQTGCRRTRFREVRFEIRRDGISGCLRASAGGSSRQFIVMPDEHQHEIRVRQMTPREGARLMGLPDTYKLPPETTTAWSLIGDGVCVPVVKAVIDAVKPHLIAV